MQGTSNRTLELPFAFFFSAVAKALKPSQPPNSSLISRQGIGKIDYRSLYLYFAPYMQLNRGRADSEETSLLDLSTPIAS